MNTSTEERIKNILTAILDIDYNDIEKASRGVTTEWDSMAWVNIIAALEDEFDIELNDNDYDLISSYDQILELIKLKIAS